MELRHWHQVIGTRWRAAPGEMQRQLVTPNVPSIMRLEYADKVLFSGSPAGVAMRPPLNNPDTMDDIYR